MFLSLHFHTAMLWSERLGRLVAMSARPRDNAALEAFLMQEFISDPRRSR